MDLEVYRVFLRQIGYLVPEGSDLKIQTSNVGPEIDSVAGPQLVVPVMSLRPGRRTARHGEEYHQDGIMDEERRNLKEWIRAAADRGLHEHGPPRPYRGLNPYIDGSAAR